MHRALFYNFIVIYRHIDIYAYKHIHTHTHIYIYMYIYTYIYIYICTHGEKNIVLVLVPRVDSDK